VTKQDVQGKTIHTATVEKDHLVTKYNKFNSCKLVDPVSFINC
jgi:hypothetical protein